MHWREFLAREGERQLSFDRISIAPLAQVTTIARSQGHSFQGWAVIAADDAGKNGRRVVSSPQQGNRYHSDIVLPAAATIDSEIRKQHATELKAMTRRWQEPLPGS